MPAGFDFAPATPLGTRDAVGIVWDYPPDPEIGHNRLRAATAKFDALPVSAAVRHFVDGWRTTR